MLASSLLVDPSVPSWSCLSIALGVTEPMVENREFVDASVTYMSPSPGNELLVFDFSMFLDSLGATSAAGAIVSMVLVVMDPAGEIQAVDDAFVSSLASSGNGFMFDICMLLDCSLFGSSVATGSLLDTSLGGREIKGEN